MLTKVQKWGNSLAFRLPKVLADEVDIQCDSPIEITVRENLIVIEPLRKRKIYNLDQLLEQVTPENCHQETDFGRSAGREVW